eukprot:Opistho-2@96193
MTTPLSAAKQTARVKIKPVHQPISMDANYVNDTWRLLRLAIVEIQRKNSGKLAFEELYRNAYNLVLHQYGERLYTGLKEAVSVHLRDVGKQIEDAIDRNFLQTLIAAWKDHEMAMSSIRDILMYMDRVHVKRARVDPTYDLGLKYFRDEVARRPRVKEHLQATLLDMIRREREGEVVDRSLLKSACTMLIDLGVSSRSVYEDDFEKDFLTTTSDFYRAESQRFISENNASDYMRKAETRMREEVERVLHYLDAGTEVKLRAVVDRELISNHMKTIIEMERSGLIPMLQNDRVEDLGRMYSLFGRVDGHQTMRDHIVAHVKETGKGIVDAINHASAAPVLGEEGQPSEGPGSSAAASNSVSGTDAIRYVQQLLDLRDKYDNLLKASFVADKKFRDAINSAFEHFINASPKSPEYISLFIDDKLKKGLKGVSEEEIESVLDRTMMLFRYLSEKDIFERYYKQHLAKRLLLAKSVSDDAERSLIGKLKAECGYQFTSKLEGMFKDISVSSDLMVTFKTFLDSSQSDLRSVDLNVRVLTTGYWPTNPNSSRCNLPPELSHACDVFQNFYYSKHTGRRLTWQSNLGSGDVKAVFGGKSHELTVSTHQMVVLLLFNNHQDGHQLTFQDIQQETDIPEADLRRTLQSLALGKYRILTKEPKTREVGALHTFGVNEKFTCKLFRIKIQAIASKETDAECAETRSKVDDDRKHEIEAAIVRVMKARKTMDHANLVSEVTRQLSSRFEPNPIMIKKRVEALIDREFLARSQENRNMYVYLA